MERISYDDIPRGMFEHLRKLEDFIKQSTIDSQLLELMRLRVSQKNGCAYCVDMHYKELKKLGETALRLSSVCVWKETPYFSEKERAVLTFADALTKLKRIPFPDEVYNPLLNFFTKEEISVLSLAISQINTWNRLMKVFLFIPGNYVAT
jgi:AhpD family alkylhydroperoxidase